MTSADASKVSPKVTPEVPPKKVGKNKKYFNSYTDLGNHWVKVLVSGYDLIREPSYFSNCITGTSAEISGHVKYLEGGATRLIDKCWIIGEQALRANNPDLTRLVDEYMGKSTLWLEFFLGSLATISQPNPHQIHTVKVTCNDVKRHEEGIKQAEGVHIVELRGVRCEIEIKIEGVYPEGYAALRQSKLQGNVTLCDIGGGNVSISRFSEGKLIAQPEVKDFGCESILDQLAKSSALKQLIKEAPSKFLLNKSLEAGIKKTPEGTALYYGKTKLNFLDIYTEVLNDFIRCNFKAVGAVLNKAKNMGDTILIIGGGSKLPIIGSKLKEKGFVVSPTGATDNVTGLMD